MDTPKVETYCTCRELARALQVCTNTVRKWTRSGHIPCVRLTRRTVRYNMRDVLEALKARPAEVNQ